MWNDHTTSIKGENAAPQEDPAENNPVLGETRFRKARDIRRLGTETSASAAREQEDVAAECHDGWKSLARGRKAGFQIPGEAFGSKPRTSVTRVAVEWIL